MRSFLTLVGFEYKKVFKRKSAVIALIVGMVITCISPLMVFFGTSYVDGEPFESHYQAMIKDREYAMALSGQALDATLLMKTRDAYLKIPMVERYRITAEYQQYARPYKDVFHVMDWTYKIDMESLRVLTDDDLGDFYQTRHEEVVQEIRAGASSEAVKETLIKLDREIKTPFIFAYSAGWDNYVGSVYTLGIIGAFILAICFAPMFAGEYSTRADQLILSSKLGKGKLISAKLFTVLSLSVLYFAVLVSIVVILCAKIFGFDGGNVPQQLIMPFLAYPLTILQGVVIFTVCTFFGTLLTVALTLLLSAKFKSPFGVIIVISVLLFTPLMLRVPETMVWLYNLFSLLPTSMMSAWSIFSHVPYELFGLILLPYVFQPVFAILATIAILTIAWKSIHNHQIG
jgi:ABC-type transport system involved in multi-copper enzyme maturation permease subunit